MNFNSDKNQAAEAARKIRLLALEVEGILTDGRLYYSNNGEELKAFHALVDTASKDYRKTKSRSL